MTCLSSKTCGSSRPESEPWYEASRFRTIDCFSHLVPSGHRGHEAPCSLTLSANDAEAPACIGCRRTPGGKARKTRKEWSERLQ